MNDPFVEKGKVKEPRYMQNKKDWRISLPATLFLYFQVIDESMKCFKAFFRWLYVEILRLSDETVSEELSKASQQDVEFISEFLNSFSRAADNDSYTYLERVGQYLKNENLAQPVDR